MTTLPKPSTWKSAAAFHEELFAGLEPGARIGLVAREAPGAMLIWEAGDAGIEVRSAPFTGFSSSDVDILLSANEQALAAICGSDDAQLFAVFRAGIRSGAIICYMLSRRCVLEAQGFEEMLEALGFAFMGACR